MHSTTGEGVSATRVVAVPHVATRGGLEEGCLALVTGKLGCGGLANRKLEDVSSVGGVVEVSVEPPLIEVHVHKGSDGTVVVWERLLRDVETVHTRVEKS